MAKGSDGQATVVTILSSTRSGRPTRETWADGFLGNLPTSRARSIFFFPLSHFRYLPVCVMSSTYYESVRFVGENNPGEDPFEATSRMAGSQFTDLSSGRRRSLCMMAAAVRRLIDEDDEEDEIEGEASSPGENEGMTIGPKPVRSSSSSAHLGPSSLQTSHISQMRREFFIPDSQVIYTPGPQSSAPSPQTNCLSFFLAQVRASLCIS
ncbi:UNVERIFIED_CONTAM: hypothetical protein Slati_3149800 [Sesamum latifolium]|uniref:Uncharacterized protein n=1 Tax=Sesamum latifolium TaxID=2727402 RepID=A0AAW2UVH9_9LAMI